jgi:hypothetical protein
LPKQGVGSDLLVRDPGLPRNLDIIPRVRRIGVTSSRTRRGALLLCPLLLSP